MADDYRNTYNGSGTLGSTTPGGSATGSFEVANDEDIFAVNLVAGRTYTFEIQGASSGFTVADPSFYLRDSVGSAVGFSSGIGGGNTNDRLVFTAQTSATFYIDAFGGGGTGTYRVLADAGFVDDYHDRYDDTIEALGTLTPGGSKTGSFEVANDEDIFAVNLVAGRTYTFEIQGASSGFTVADPSFYLRDSVGSAVGFSSGIGGGNTNDRLVFTAQTSGTFYVDAFSGGATGTYKVLADAGYVDDYRDVYNASIEALGSLTTGGSTDGIFEIATDQDIFQVSLVAGQTYTFEIQGASSGFTIADPSFYLRDSAGSAVGFSSSIGGGSTNDRLVYTAAASGTFYIDAFANGGTGTYRIVAPGNFADDFRDTYNDTNEALGTVSAGGNATGSIEIANDQDIFSVNLTAGRTYTIDMQGASSGYTLADPSFYLRDSAGSAIGFSVDADGASTNNRLIFTVTASGTYYLDAFGDGGTGTYRLLVNSGFVDDFRDTYNDTNEALGAVSTGGSATGTIELANDQDIFSVNLVAGRTYTIDMQGVSAGFTLADPSFYLRNSTGAAVGFPGDAAGASTDDRLIFTASASGTYYIDAFGVGGTGTYKVLVDNGFVDDFRDSYNDTVEALGALSAGGSATGNLELASDQDIFRISLTAGQTYVFDIEGASSGFTLGDPTFSLRNSAGGAVGFSTGIGGGSTNDRLTYTATASGFYYVDAGGIGTGTYRLTASAGTILNGDVTLAISATSASKPEGNSGSTPFSFTVTRGGTSSATHSVHWAVGGAAVTAADFAGGILPSGTVTFAAGETSKTVSVNVASDNVVESNEAFTVTLSSPSTGATLGTASATGTIVNDDASLSISAVTSSKAEGQSGSTPFTFTVIRTGDTSVAHSASWVVSGAAVTAADFVGGVLPSGTVSFAAGQTSSTITVNVVGNTTVEASEAFTVTLSGPSSGATLGTATATSTILNDDASLSISAVTSSKAEGQSGSTPFSFTITRTGDISVAHSASWVVSGAAISAADFVGGVLPSGTVSFAAGQTTSTITVNVVGNTTVEASEAFTVTLSGPSSGATLGTATATTTILNDDASLSISAVTSSKAEGQSGSTPFSFTITRTGDISVAHSASWVVSGATISAADFVGGVLPSGTVSFAAGETTSTITVNVVGNTTVEAGEAFTVTLSGPSSGATLGTATATTTILNDDASLSIFAVTSSKAEGQSGSTPFTFTVTRTGDTSVAHSAHWAVSGAAVTGADFVGGVLPSGTVSFAAGQTTSTITVNVAGDTTVEANEAFTVTLSGPSTGATLGTASATSTIVNDDTSATVISIASATADIAEGAAGATTPFTFNVMRTGNATAAGSVAWTVGGPAVTGADFTGGVLPAGTVNFAAGETVKTISVSVAGDRAVEGDESFTVTLSNPGTGASLGTVSATGVIRNDDASSGNNPLTGTSNVDYIDGLAGDDSIYGRDGNDVLVGRDGNDLLDGGAGADVMVGGAGNDSYYVDQSGDSVIEVDALHGVDTVFSSISYTLGENVENLTLIGTAAINGTGNGGGNVLTGNAAANTLSGGAGNDTLDGGAGVDTLIGGSGADTFVFSSPLVAGKYDTIAGFDANADTVKLSKTVFLAFASASSVASNAFELGSAATSSLTRLLYDSASGALLYDSDGSGGATAIQFASMTGLTGTFSAADFKLG